MRSFPRHGLQWDVAREPAEGPAGLMMEAAGIAASEEKSSIAGKKRGFFA
jgi:hypothetical protein